MTNLIVWGIEQYIDVDFEFLSVSCIATEIMLLAIYSMLRDYGIVQPGGVLFFILFIVLGLLVPIAVIVLIVIIIIVIVKKKKAKKAKNEEQ